MTSFSRNNNANLVNSQRLWTDAISILPSKGLSDEELEYFSLARREDVLEDIKKFEAQHASSSIMRGVSKQISPFLDCIWSYATAIDVITNIQPMPLSPVWAIVRMVIQAARAFEEYFTKLVAMLERIGDVLPRFDLYIQMFPMHQNLVIGVSRIYADIIQFCVKAKRVFSAEAQTEKKKFGLGSSSKAAFKVTWANFEAQFGKILDAFREHKAYIEDEAKAAAMNDIQTRLQTLQVHAEVQHENMLEIIKFQKDFAAAQGRHYRYTTRDHLLAWLDPQKLDERRLKTLLQIRTSQTGLWFLKSQVFTDWLAVKGSNILWVRGVAGAGKSVLCAQTVEHVASTMSNTKPDEPQGRPVLYHFCDFSNTRTTQLVSILASLLNQLLTFRPDYKFSDEDERLFDAKQQEGPLNDSAFWYDIKRMIIEVGNPFYLFIDGLDECEDRNTIIDVLVQLVNDLGAFILVASRDEVDLRIGLQDVSVLQLDPKVLESDIALFVRDETARLVREKKLRTRDPKLPAVIECQLAERSNGVFLWVKLQLLEICRKRTDKSMRLAIEEVPRSLSEGYLRSLAKFTALTNDDQKLVQLLFQWCVFAARPMTTSELGVCLLAVDAETCSLHEDDIITEPDTLSSLTDGLITLRDIPVAEKTDYSSPEEESQSTVLILSHKSIQDFILSAEAGRFLLQPEIVHATLATTCLAYLLMRDLSSPCVTWEQMRERFTVFPFLDYAARHWPLHLIQAQYDAKSMLLAEKLFTGPSFLPWLQIYKYYRGTRSARTYHKDARPLYWAARLSLVPLLKKLLAGGADVNQPGGYFGTALHMAAFNGSTNVAEVLLDHGADINLPVETIGSPLQAAVMGYQDEMIHFLLSKKAKPDSAALKLAKTTEQQTAIDALIREGAVDISEETDKEEAPSEAESLLIRAITDWDLSALHKALTLGVNVNNPITITGYKRAYPLLHALETWFCKRNNKSSRDAPTYLDIMRGLIDAGADVNIYDGYHGSILALAAYRHDEGVVRLLLEKGANPLLETYSGGGIYRIIHAMDKETKDAMNNGKGLHAWIDELEDPLSSDSYKRGGERSSIIAAIQSQQLLETRKAFGQSDETRKAQAAKTLPALRQTTSVQAYIQSFDTCADLLEIDSALKKTFFLKGLKLHVREALVSNDGPAKSYEWACQEAQRIDDELYRLPWRPRTRTIQG